MTAARNGCRESSLNPTLVDCLHRRGLAVSLVASESGSRICRFLLTAFMIALMLAPGGITSAQSQTYIPSLSPLPLTPGAPTGTPAPAPGPVVPQMPPATPQPQAPSAASLPPGPAGAPYPDSDVFGANLFTGAFVRESVSRFNPDYLLQVGDTVQVRLWGAFNFDAPLTLDAQGNIFLPNLGPVALLGVRNQDLQQVVEAAVRRVYRNNVFVYATLAAAQPVRVYVGGFVNRPGLYEGTSLDSPLRFLDLAGGIDPQRGTFLDIQIKRGNQIRAKVNLYDFLLHGRIPHIQLADGDVIFVPPRQDTVKISGLVESPKRFEFADLHERTLADVVRIAKPLAQATHVRVIRNTGTVRNIEYYSIADAGSVRLQNGDEVEFTADKKPGTITVRVEGEHQSPQEYVLPYGARLGELMRHVQYLPSADVQNIQLFRRSVSERQKQMLATALKSLETSVLTARSATNEESRLRKDEAELMLQWVERAKKVEPSGQVVIAQSETRNELLLENGDIVRIPKQDGLVLISGEVISPSAIAYDPGLGPEDYIRRAGGYTQSADTSRIIVAHRDGTFTEVGDDSQRRWFAGEEGKIQVRPGDEILVLPKVQTKSIEVTRGISQILYQIAIAAKVVLGL